MRCRPIQMLLPSATKDGFTGILYHRSYQPVSRPSSRSQHLNPTPLIQLSLVLPFPPSLPLLPLLPLLPFLPHVTRQPAVPLHLLLMPITSFIWMVTAAVKTFPPMLPLPPLVHCLHHLDHHHPQLQSPVSVIPLPHALSIASVSTFGSYYVQRGLVMGSRVNRAVVESGESQVERMMIAQIVWRYCIHRQSGGRLLHLWCR